MIGYAYLVAAGVALAIVGGAYQTGKNAAARECDRASLRARVDQLTQDLAIERQARLEADRIAADIAIGAIGDEERVRDLEAEVAKRPAADRCALSADDVRRLRAIGGGSGTAPTSRRP